MFQEITRAYIRSSRYDKPTLQSVVDHAGTTEVLDSGTTDRHEAAAFNSNHLLNVLLSARATTPPSSGPARTPDAIAFGDTQTS